MQPDIHPLSKSEKMHVLYPSLPAKSCLQIFSINSLSLNVICIRSLVSSSEY